MPAPRKVNVTQLQVSNNIYTITHMAPKATHVAVTFSGQSTCLELPLLSAEGTTQNDTVTAWLEDHQNHKGLRFTTALS